MATLPKVEAYAQANHPPTAPSIQPSGNRIVQSGIEVIEYIKLHREPNPHLQLKRVVRNSSTGEDIRHATAEFWLEGKDSSGESRRLWDLSLLKESNHRSTKGETEDAENAEDADEAEEKGTTSIKFRYATAVVSGVDQIPENWPARVKRSMNQLSGYRKDGVVTIPLARIIGDSPQKVLNYLHYHKPGKLWKDYDSVSWKGLDKLYNGKHLSISSPVTKHDARCHFASPREAMIKLSVGRFVEQKWEELMYKELCKGGFNAAFFILGPTTAVACLRRKDPTIFINPNAVFDDHMTIIMKFDSKIDNCWKNPLTPNGYETTTGLTGRIVSNQTSVNCDVVVLLDKFPPNILKFARTLQQPPRFIDLRDVYIQVIDKPAKDQVESLNEFFQRGRSKHKKWWPMLLAQKGSMEPHSNFIQLVG